jgi:hypothetical protein
LTRFKFSNFGDVALARREEALAAWEEKVRIAEKALIKVSADLDVERAKAYSTRNEYLDKMEKHKFGVMCPGVVFLDSASGPPNYWCFLHQQITRWSRSRVPVLWWSHEQLALGG